MKPAAYPAVYSKAAVAAVVTANIGVIMAAFAPVTNLLPHVLAKEKSGDGASLAPLAAVTGTGAAVALLTNLLVGWLSDRLAQRLRGRRPWIVAGVVLGTAALLILSTEESRVPALALTWATAQAGFNLVIAPLAAFVPEAVPRRRRGHVSALLGVGQIAGVVLAAAVSAWRPGTPRHGFLVVAIFYLLLTAPAVTVRSRPAPDTAVDSHHRPRGTYADFGYAWLSRFAMTLAGAVAIVFLFPYLRDVLRLRDPDSAQFQVVLLTAVLVAVTAVVGGRASDHSGRRKPLLVISVLVLATAQLILALAPHWAATLAAAVLIGIGYGAFLSVDQALITEVLPDVHRHARDLAVMNVAATAPQMCAPALAAFFTSGHGGYVGLYVTGSLLSLAAAVCVRAVRGIA
ncbi:MFS transporter [Streptomyces bungoensis]|uniref:MFS transporter n=1 Tax=Streptomyces bungoensis TaxID=285568 RepID=UPI0036921D70